MNEKRAKGCLLAAGVWLVILVILAVGYRFLVHPQLQKRLVSETGSTVSYDHEITLAADSFSGYAILRSDAIKSDLKAQGIKLEIQDDGADYTSRLEALRSKKVQMAVFTIDSFLTAGIRAGEFPASIVLVIDETQGGDAIVARKGAVASLQDLNAKDGKIVLTPNSPSEFLARVVIAHFNLPNLPEKWQEPADGAGEVYKRFTADRTGSHTAYVLWEPYVSRALEQSDAHVLIDSSKLKGFIVDVLVAEREFLRDHQDLVQKVLEAYGRAAYAVGLDSDGMAELVRKDAKVTGLDSLDKSQAGKVVQGIHWKNTLENYVHFGLAKPEGGLTTLEDSISKIMDVLVRTKAVPSDPLNGQYNTLYFDRVLAAMQAAQYHPARGVTLVDGIAPGSNDLERIKGQAAIRELTDSEWGRLEEVGELRVEALEFSRASDRLSIRSERELQALAKRLESFPSYYLRVIGHARAEGDPEANRILATSRATAVGRFLENLGVDTRRMRVEAAPTQARSGEGQAVSFVVGQLPY